MSDTDAWGQLMVLRGVTQTTGVLHEAQIVQLRYWPRIAAPHSTSCDIAWSPKDGRKRQCVEFRMKVGAGRPPKDFKARLQGLDRSVKALLGPDTTVRVKVGPKKLFESRGKRG